MKKVFFTASKAETQSLGMKLASLLQREDVILLQGDLGAGKTTFASGVAKALGIQEDVISPTFNIMKCYFHGRIPFYHIDAYRLEGQNIEIGLDEYIEGDGACFIEWPQFIEPFIPEEHLSISIFNRGGDSREIVAEGEGPRYESLLSSWEEE